MKEDAEDKKRKFGYICKTPLRQGLRSSSTTTRLYDTVFQFKKVKKKITKQKGLFISTDFCTLTNRDDLRSKLLVSRFTTGIEDVIRALTCTMHAGSSLFIVLIKIKNKKEKKKSNKSTWLLTNFTNHPVGEFIYKHQLI